MSASFAPFCQVVVYQRGLVSNSVPTDLKPITYCHGILTHLLYNHNFCALPLFSQLSVTNDTVSILLFKFLPCFALFARSISRTNVV